MVYGQVFYSIQNVCGRARVQSRACSNSHTDKKASLHFQSSFRNIFECTNHCDQGRNNNFITVNKGARNEIVAGSDPEMNWCKLEGEGGVSLVTQHCDNGFRSFCCCLAPNRRSTKRADPCLILGNVRAKTKFFFRLGDGRHKHRRNLTRILCIEGPPLFERGQRVGKSQHRKCQLRPHSSRFKNCHEHGQT